MNRLLLATTLSLASLTANAICPTTLSGKYSGAGQYTEQAVINNTPIISYIEYHVVSVMFSGNNLTVVKEFYAATGTGAPAIQESVGVSPFTFDKNTCTGQIGGNNDPLFFVVSDSGNSISAVHGTAPKSHYSYAEKWELKKQ